MLRVDDDTQSTSSPTVVQHYTLTNKCHLIDQCVRNTSSVFQAIKKKRIELGITSAVLRDDGSIRTAYDMAKALPLLPAADIERGIDIIAQQSTDAGSCPLSPI